MRSGPHVGGAAGLKYRNAEIGMPIAFGTGTAVYSHGMNAREFGDMADLGMTPSAALLSSSQGSAKLLGMDGETGTLEAGKFADIVAVQGDVLRDIRATYKPVSMMMQGVVVRGNTANDL